jgi:hypothetical protein
VYLIPVNGYHWDSVVGAPSGPSITYEFAGGAADLSQTSFIALRAANQPPTPVAGVSKVTFAVELEDDQGLKAIVADPSRLMVREVYLAQTIDVPKDVTRASFRQSSVPLGQFLLQNAELNMNRIRFLRIWYVVPAFRVETGLMM